MQGLLWQSNQSTCGREERIQSLRAYRLLPMSGRHTQDHFRLWNVPSVLSFAIMIRFQPFH
jgi:hypothetical protein